MASNDRSAAMRRYPPLGGVILAAVMAMFVLPSALNVPQSNPTQTLEFAPIPPEDDDPPPPQEANLESLSLGNSSTAPSADAEGGVGPGLPAPPIPGGVGDRPVTKRCVGNPPRQTEDKLSPPCVAHFDGDNGGSTYRGVTGDEIRILVYLDGTTTAGPETDAAEAAEEGCIDLATAPDASETITPKYLRVFQTYFNDRYQTYGRSARFIVCFGDSAATPETRRADAVENLADWDPFAVVMSQIRYGRMTDYADVMLGAGVLVFGSAAGAQPADYFRRYPGQLWSYLPSVEEQARLYSSYVCQKVAGRPVVDSGNAGENGGPRTFGWLATTDESQPNLLLFRDVARAGIEGCGVAFAHEATFPKAGRVTQPDNTGPAQTNISQFQLARVTTILWPGGFDTDHGKAATQVGYLPELIIAGDGIFDGTTGGLYQEDEWFAHAWTSTQQVYLAEDEESPCERAIDEAYPAAGTRDKDRVCSFPYYQDLRQLFTGIQVAGPDLSLATIDRGFHAIPGTPSDDPRVAACFYNPGDYTCVKDATSEWWDPTQNTNTGCWRMVDRGRRHVADAWDDGNIDARVSEEDPCNNYSVSPLVF